MRAAGGDFGGAFAKRRAALRPCNPARYRLATAMARASVALAASAAAALLAPAGASAAYRQFRSPTGKIGCAFYSDAETPREARCDWRGANDVTVTVDETHKGKRRKATDTVFDPKAKVLAYGHSLTFGKLRCTSRTTGMTCRSAKSGHGFTVSVEKQRVF